MDDYEIDDEVMEEVESDLKKGLTLEHIIKDMFPEVRNIRVSYRSEDRTLHAISFDTDIMFLTASFTAEGPVVISEVVVTNTVFSDNKSIEALIESLREGKRADELLRRTAKLLERHSFGESDEALVGHLDLGLPFS